MTQFFHAIATPRVSFNDGFKAFFGFAVLALVIAGTILSFTTDSTLSFGRGVFFGVLGGVVGLVVRNILVGRPKG